MRATRGVGSDRRPTPLRSGARRARARRHPRSIRVPLAVALALSAAVNATLACAARGPVDAGAEDRRISDEVRRIGTDVDGLDLEYFEVETRDGVVILTGVQSSREAVSELLQRVARVRGVRQVVNRIRLIRDGPTADGRRPPAAAAAGNR